jgi:hypothetical protein
MCSSNYQFHPLNYQIAIGNIIYGPSGSKSLLSKPVKVSRDSVDNGLVAVNSLSLDEEKLTPENFRCNMSEHDPEPITYTCSRTSSKNWI